MFLFLSKLLPLLLYPVGLATILLILGLWLRKNPKWGQRFILLAILVLWLGGNRWVAGWLARSLEWQYLPPEELPGAEAIVVLGGGTKSLLYPRPIVEIGEAGDRVIYGAWLYQQGKAPLILLTGGNLPWSETPSSPASDMASLVSIIGVPEDAILLEPNSRNTYENALFSREILERKGINRILLVTSANHMPRSVKLFEKQGFEVIPAPTDFSMTVDFEESDWRDTWPELVLGLFPNAVYLERTTGAMREYIGILVYWLRGWI